MTAPPCHLLPSLDSLYPVCGEDGLLSTFCTMQPTLVTCPRCRQILMYPDRPPQATRAPRRVTGEREQTFLERVRRAARDNSWLVYHTYRSDHSEPGFPDLILAKPGRPVIAAELKTSRGKLSRAQDRWLRTLEQTEGLTAFLWRPGDYDAIQELLRR